MGVETKGSPVPFGLPEDVVPLRRGGRGERLPVLFTWCLRRPSLMVKTLALSERECLLGECTGNRNNWSQPIWLCLMADKS